MAGPAASGGSTGAIRAGRAFVELAADDSKLKAGLDKAQAKVAAFTQVAKGVFRRNTGADAGRLVRFDEAGDAIDLRREALKKKKEMEKEWLAAVREAAKEAEKAQKEAADRSARRWRTAGAVALGGAALGLGAVGKGFADALTYGADINAISKRFGAGAEGISELAGGFAVAGVDVKAFGSVLDGLNAQIVGAANAGPACAPT